MVYYDDEFDAWRSTECGLFHAMYHSKEEAEVAEPKLREFMKEYNERINDVNNNKTS